MILPTRTFEKIKDFRIELDSGFLANVTIAVFEFFLLFVGTKVGNDEVEDEADFLFEGGCLIHRISRIVSDEVRCEDHCEISAVHEVLLDKLRETDDT